MPLTVHFFIREALFRIKTGAWLVLCRVMPLARMCRGFLSIVCFLPSLHGSTAESGSPTQVDTQTTAAEVFPDITAEALDRSLIDVPKQLEGRKNLVFLFWARDQEAQIDTWTTAAQAIQHASFDFRVYRMLVSARENALYRWWDNNSLRSAETDPEMLHWTVPLYTDKTQLRHALGIADNERTIAVMLLDRGGHVLWKARGPSTEAGRAGLLAAAQGK